MSCQRLEREAFQKKASQQTFRSVLGHPSIDIIVSTECCVRHHRKIYMSGCGKVGGGIDYPIEIHARAAVGIATTGGEAGDHQELSKGAGGMGVCDTYEKPSHVAQCYIT